MHQLPGRPCPNMPSSFFHEKHYLYELAIQGVHGTFIKNIISEECAFINGRQLSHWRGWGSAKDFDLKCVKIEINYLSIL